MTSKREAPQSWASSPSRGLQRYVTQMPPSGLRASGQVSHLVPELKKEPKKDILRMASRQLQLQAKATMQLP